MTPDRQERVDNEWDTLEDSEQEDATNAGCENPENVALHTVKCIDAYS